MEPKAWTDRDTKEMSVMYGLLAWDLVKARRAEIDRAAERARFERTARPAKRRTTKTTGR